MTDTKAQGPERDGIRSVIEALADEMWRVHPKELDAAGYVHISHGGKYENPRASWYADKIEALIRSLEPKDTCPCCGGTGAYGDACVRSMDGLISPTRPDTIQTVTLTEAEQAAFESGRKVGWNEGVDAAAYAADQHYQAEWAAKAIRALSMPAPTRQEADNQNYANQLSSSGWQPIEAAPNGTALLVSAWMFGEQDGQRFVCCGTFREDHGVWMGDDGEELWEPTHWMPLPAPPQPTEGG